MASLHGHSRRYHVIRVARLMRGSKGALSARGTMRLSMAELSEGVVRER